MLFPFLAYVHKWTCQKWHFPKREISDLSHSYVDVLNFELRFLSLAPCKYRGMSNDFGVESSQESPCAIRFHFRATSQNCYIAVMHFCPIYINFSMHDIKLLST